MITYVNTVFVSNLTSGNLIGTKTDYDAISTSDAGKFVIITVDPKNSSDASPYYPVINTSNASYYERIKIGMITDKVMKKVDYKTGATTDVPVIKWSNVISADSIKSITARNYEDDTEDTAYINFANLDQDTLNKYDDGGKRIIVRLTFKDMPHKLRKWTESYEYTTKAGDTAATIATGITNMINKEWKRARVTVSQGNYNASTKAFTAANNGTAVKIEALKYDDDNSVDSLSWANKVRFNVNIYWTDPEANGWEANNKHFPKGVTIDKVPGKTYIASAKLVRDREAQAMGYLGILNHGEGTWPIIQPAMTVNLANKYCATTIEFERMYRAADDHQRTTKETVELYTACTLDPETGAISANGAAGIRSVLSAFTSLQQDSNEFVPETI